MSEKKEEMTITAASQENVAEEAKVEVEVLEGEIVEEMPKEKVSNEDVEELKKTGKKIMENFKKYISSNEFDKKCEEEAEKNGVDKDIVKNGFLKNSVKSIARTLHLTVKITGDVLKSVVHFINTIINNIVDFSSSVLHKLINLVTLNVANS